MLTESRPGDVKGSAGDPFAIAKFGSLCKTRHKKVNVKRQSIFESFIFKRTEKEKTRVETHCVGVALQGE